jgi:AMP deaminase
LNIRQKYCRLSYQEFPANVERFLGMMNGKPVTEPDTIVSKATIADHPIHPPQMEGDPWDCEVLPDCGYTFRIKKGIFHIYANNEDKEQDKPIPFEVPDLTTFVGDMQHLCAMIADGPLKSFCYRRLSYLKSKYELHVLLNELRELDGQ